MTQQYDNKGQISLWNNQKTNERAPDMKGSFFAHRDISAGEKIDVSIWNNMTDNAKAPVLKGKISDVYMKPEGAPAVAQPVDDNIPF